MAEAGFPELIKRLDAVIALLVVALPQSEQPRSLRDQIKLLDAAGMSPSEIARIIDRPATSINSELARIRGSKSGKPREKE
jgi:DNA-directed RNA polymerase specialized sigma24 family protein